MSPLASNPLSFIDRSRPEVARRLLARLPKLTDFTFTGEGSLIRAIMESVAAETGDMYALLNFSYGQQVVATATGANLDALGMLYGVTRRVVSATQPVDTFYFYLANSENHQIGIPEVGASEGFVIPLGTFITHRDDVVGDTYAFTTTQNVVFEIGDMIHFTPIEPSTGALKTNFGPHQLTVHDYDGTLSSQVYCTNPVEVSADTTAETDEAYRPRIIAAVRSIATSNVTAIKMAALSVHNVRDVKVLEREYGPATMKVVYSLDYGATSVSTSTVRAQIDVVRPVGSYVSVMQAYQYTTDIDFGLEAEDSDDIQYMVKAVEYAIRNYFGTLGIGDPLRRSKLLERMSVSVPTAKDVYIASIKVNGVEFTGELYKIPSDTTFSIGSITTIT